MIVTNEEYRQCFLEGLSNIMYKATSEASDLNTEIKEEDDKAAVDGEGRRLAGKRIASLENRQKDNGERVS